MQRILEPELMDDPLQAAAYAAADFSEPHGLFIKKFQEVFFGTNITGQVLDLGCGPADISIRFARTYPACHIYGVEGSPAMLLEGKAALVRTGLQQQVELIQGLIPGVELPQRKYQVILSNSLVHHLHDPSVLWKFIKKYSDVDTLICIMDLMRPGTPREARELVNTYCGKEPQILRQDFYSSLCAALCPQEVKLQLEDAGLQELTLDIISDRHWMVNGIITNAQR